MSSLANIIGQVVTKVTKEYTRERKRSFGRREDYVSQRTIDRWNKKKTEQQLKAAAYEVLEACYNKVSDNGRRWANKNQMFYAVRPHVLKATGKIWKERNTFTQGVLRDFMRDYPELTKGWKIAADARGHFAEPHVKQRIGIGTLEVRGYVGAWRKKPGESDLKIDIDDIFPTHGPDNRYKFALFIEKEGFDEILADERIAERYDLAIFSSKGQTVEATRQLVEWLSAAGVTILVAHDFDRSGMSIAHWLSHSNDTYQFKHAPRVIDIGLRLSDAREMRLQSEEQFHEQRKDPTDIFLDYDDCDLTDEEFDFLRGRRRNYKLWEGQRVELNAIPTSAQFIKWLEKKLVEAGVKKVIPDEETLKLGLKRARKIARARALIAEMEDDDEPPPANLKKLVAAQLKDHPELSWDSALVKIASDHDAKVIRYNFEKTRGSKQATRRAKK
jgi:hypothetical protein